MQARCPPHRAGGPLSRCTRRVPQGLRLPRLEVQAGQPPLPQGQIAAGGRLVNFMRSKEARLRLTKIHLGKLTLGLPPCLELVGAELWSS